jgi:hypothetical protein
VSKFPECRVIDVVRDLVVVDGCDGRGGDGRVADVNAVHVSTPLISMAMEPSCLDGSRLLLARPGPYHQVTPAIRFTSPSSNAAVDRS